MKPDKGNPPKLLASKVKKKDLNTSASKSYRSKSSTRYIADLRANNIRLARFVAFHKSQAAECFSRFNEVQAQLFQQQAEIRVIAQSVKAGIKKFQQGLDSLIDASDLMEGANRRLLSLCPEIFNASSSEANTATVSNDVLSSKMNFESQVRPAAGVTVTEETEVKGTPNKIRESRAVRPMVQGQVISNPTISLQRVVISRIGRGFSNRQQPLRGSDLDEGNEQRERPLSDLPEENESLDESSGRSPPGLTSPGQVSIQALQDSHVVLERINSDLLSNSTDIQCEDYDERTEVHFGSFNFSLDAHSDSAPVLDPRSAFSSPVDKENSTPPTNSDEYITESSSEDEDIAVQILEAKRHLLKSSMRSDLREGTSWNYDDTGKFHEKPPRKKSRKYQKKHDGGNSPKSRVTKRSAEEELPGPRLRKMRQPLEELPTAQHSSPNSLNKSNDSYDHLGTKPASDSLDETTLSEANMSFTCVIDKSNLPVNQSPENQTLCGEADMSFTCVVDKSNLPVNERLNNQTVCEDADMSSTCVHDELKFPVRNSLSNQPDNRDNVPEHENVTYVTQRTRNRRRNVSEGCSDACAATLRPFSPASKSSHGNNENSPPCNVPHPLSPMKSYVVLERLPKSVTSGNYLHSFSEESKEGVQSSTSVLGISKLSQPLRCSYVPLGSIDTPISPTRRSFRTLSPPTNSKNLVRKSILNDRPPKRKPARKTRNKSNGKGRCSNPDTTNNQQVLCQGVSISAPSSPSNASAYESDDSSYSETGRRRPRRHAAPTVLREPKLTTKLRRPS